MNVQVGAGGTVWKQSGEDSIVTLANSTVPLMKGLGGVAGTGGSMGGVGGGTGGTGGGPLGGVGGAGGTDPGCGPANSWGIHTGSMGNSGSPGSKYGGGGGGGSGGKTCGALIGDSHNGGPGAAGANGLVIIFWE